MPGIAARAVLLRSLSKHRGNRHRSPLGVVSSDPGCTRCERAMEVRLTALAQVSSLRMRTRSGRSGVRTAPSSAPITSTALSKQPWSARLGAALSSLAVAGSNILPTPTDGPRERPKRGNPSRRDEQRAGRALFY